MEVLIIDRGPYFDKSASKNVTALVGKTTNLNCRIRNLGNRTVSEKYISILISDMWINVFLNFNKETYSIKVKYYIFHYLYKYKYRILLEGIWRDIIQWPIYNKLDGPFTEENF